LRRTPILNRPVSGGQVSTIAREIFNLVEVRSDSIETRRTSDFVRLTNQKIPVELEGIL